jgi:hypothetical protein
MSSLDQLNTFLATATQALSCTGDCKKQQKAEKLKEKWLAAETQAAGSQAAIEKAYRKYITFTEGPRVYREKQEEKFQQEANREVQRRWTSFQQQQQQTDKSRYATTATTTDKELLEKIQLENRHLKERRDDAINDTLTNDRRIYYETEQTTWATRVRLLLQIVYVVIFLVFVGKHFQDLRFRVRGTWIQLVVLLLLPWAGVWAFLSVVHAMRGINVIAT